MKKSIFTIGTIKNVGYVILINLGFLSLNLSAQEESILVELKNPNQIQALKSVYKVDYAERAFPSSRNPELQNVFEIKSSSDLHKLFDHMSNDRGFVKPVITEPIQLLEDPNDYNVRFATDYALDLIRAKEAWTLSHGSSAISLGISDSNFDVEHEELQGKFSFIQNNLTHSNINHGTSVAVTAAGNTNNELGKSNIGYNCDLMLYGMGYNSILEASYAGARVINLSWASGCNFNAYQQSVIREAYENGTIVVAAAGNGNTCNAAQNYVYPAAYDYVIAVSSIGPEDNHERIIGNAGTTHQHNDKVDIVAPGYNVALALANNHYTSGNGTSFAAPFVTGTIGLMLSENPCLTYENVLTILQETAVDIYDKNPNYVGLLGAGRLDAYEAVKRAKNFTVIDYNYEASYNCETDLYTIAIQPIGTSSFDIIWEDGQTDFDRTVSNRENISFEILSDEGCSLDGNIDLTAYGMKYDYEGLITVSSSDFELEDQDGDGEIWVKGVIKIEEGIEFEISDKLIYFFDDKELRAETDYQHSGIYVDNDAFLTLDNVVLSTKKSCQERWDGIYMNNTTLEDIDRFSQYPFNLVVNNSTIENAKVAISNYSMHSDFVVDHLIGGKINVLNSNFRNNDFSIRLAPDANLSETTFIKSSNFVTSEDIKFANYIRINGGENIHIEKCYFSGNQSNLTSSAGYAISVNNTANIVAKNNSFERVGKGVEVENNEEENVLMELSNNHFKLIERGISVIGAFEGVIISNSIELTLGSSTSEAIGILINGSNELLVSENELTSEYSNGYNYGTFIDGGDQEANKTILFKNTFFGSFEAASKFTENNADVKAHCNTYFTDGQTNWFVAGYFGNSKENQGKLFVNDFSVCDDVTNNILTSNSCSPFEYFTSVDFEPTCIEGNVTLRTMEYTPSWDELCATSNGMVVDLANTNEDVREEVLFDVYPNPSSGVINVKWNGEAVTGLQVFNTQSRLISEVTMHEMESQTTLNLTVSGIYFVRLTNRDGSFQTKKVIIQ